MFHWASALKRVGARASAVLAGEGIVRIHELTEKRHLLFHDRPSIHITFKLVRRLVGVFVLHVLL